MERANPFRALVAGLTADEFLLFREAVGERHCRNEVGVGTLAVAAAAYWPDLDWQHLFGRFREGQPRFPELDRRHVAQRRVDPEVVVPVHVVRELGP